MAEKTNEPSTKRQPGDSSIIKPTRKRSKPQPPPQPPAEASDSAPESETLPPGVVDLEIEAHEVQPAPTRGGGFGDMLRQAGDKIGLFYGDDDDSTDEPETGSSKKRGRGRPPSKNTQEDFITLTIALLTLVISVWDVPEEVKPDKHELKAFSSHLTSLMLRHLPINGKLTADALDIIGLIAVMSGYWARVSPSIRELRQARLAEKNGLTPPPVVHQTPPAETRREVAPLNGRRGTTPTDLYLSHVAEVANATPN